MRLYLIAILVAAIGLWLSNAVQAAELCGLRSDHVFIVEKWQAEPAADDEIDYTITLKSTDDKAINAVGGTIEFFVGRKSIASIGIALDQPVAAHSETTLYLGGTNDQNSDRLPKIEKSKVQVLACIDHVDYSDGSGVIIN